MLLGVAIVFIASVTYSAFVRPPVGVNASVCVLSVNAIKMETPTSVPTVVAIPVAQQPVHGTRIGWFNDHGPHIVVVGAAYAVEPPPSRHKAATVAPAPPMIRDDERSGMSLPPQRKTLKAPKRDARGVCASCLSCGLSGLKHNGFDDTWLACCTVPATCGGSAGSCLDGCLCVTCP